VWRRMCSSPRARPSTTPRAGETINWCLLIMGPAGPDDGLVHADSCDRGHVVCAVAAEEDVA
jgi:hypothetical protein